VVFSYAVHAADLSNPLRPFHMTQRWARWVSDEFNAQVDKEKAMGYPVTAIFTADDEALCKNEVRVVVFLEGSCGFFVDTFRVRRLCCV
jgi:hypothetical protein